LCHSHSFCHQKAVPDAHHPMSSSFSTLLGNNCLTK